MGNIRRARENTNDIGPSLCKGGPFFVHRVNFAKNLKKCWFQLETISGIIQDNRVRATVPIVHDYKVSDGKRLRHLQEGYGVYGQISEFGKCRVSGGTKRPVCG